VSVGARPRKQRRGDVADLWPVADGHLERHAAADGQWVKVKPVGEDTYLAFRVSSGSTCGRVPDPLCDLELVRSGPALAPPEPSSLAEYGRRSPHLQVVRSRLRLRALHLG